jgi:hypothetical protein
MNLKRVEQLLREYARLRPPQRLLSDEAQARLRDKLAPPQSGEEAPEPARAEEPGAMPTAARGSDRRLRRIAFGAAAAAAALLFLAAWLIYPRTPEAAPGLTVDGAYDKASLFRTTRGVPPDAGVRGNSFYIGVRANRAAHVRVIAIDERGQLELLPLDRSGATEVTVEAGAETAFGGYELGPDGDDTAAAVTEFIVLACVEPLAERDISAWIDETNSAARDGAGRSASELASELKSRFNCAAEILSP